MAGLPQIESGERFPFSTASRLKDLSTCNFLKKLQIKSVTCNFWKKLQLKSVTCNFGKKLQNNL